MPIQTQSATLITGAHGFIGRAVARLLEGPGQRLVLLDQVAPEIRSGQDSSPGVVCDISQEGEVRRLFEAESIGRIIHLAAILPTAAQRNPLRGTQVNVMGSLNLLAIGHEFGVGRFVFASSLSIYGTCPANQVISEHDRSAPEDLYGAAKLYVEQLGSACAGLSFVSLRIGRVVGPGAKSKTSAWRSEIFEFLDADEPTRIKLPYLGRERVLLVHVDDIAKALVSLLRATRLSHGVYNAPCESVVVEDLKHQVEALNPNITVELGETYAAGNPRRLDFSRFHGEFGSKGLPIFERLKAAGVKNARAIRQSGPRSATFDSGEQD
jgi:nucleoside-diphosphate-sugar epimerase